MALYDIFIKHEHSLFLQKVLINFNQNILNSILRYGNLRDVPVEVLEIGPGKGYFYQAIKDNSRCSYSALDRNSSIVKSLGVKDYYLCGLPSAPDFKKKFDIIYVSYVLEHLKNGIEVFRFFDNYKKYLKKGGVMVIFVPDTMKMGMEFWNIDYTHIYPTNKRNITMALNEAGFDNIDIYDINGLLTPKGFTSRLFYLLIRMIVLLYNYKFFSFFVPRKCGLSNLFYKIYCFFKEENLMFVVKNNNLNDK